MTAQHVLRPFLPALFVILSVLTGILASTSHLLHAADLPDETFAATSANRYTLSGDNTYAQISTDSRSGNNFTFENGTLTLTGNKDGALFLAPRARNPLANISSDAGNAMLVLQKGTFSGSIALGGNSNSSTLMVGSGATDANLPDVTITGNMRGSNNATSRIVTNGANLVITGNVGDSHYVGEMHAQNGNISMTQPSRQNQVGLIDVASGMQLSSSTRLVLHDLALQNNASVLSDAEIHINGALGRTANRMQPGSLLWARSDISFLDPQATGTGGILNASGTIRADGNIGSYGAFSTYDMLQGDGHMRLEAGRDIGGGDITADAVTAGGTIVAGSDRTSVAQFGVSGYFPSITPNKTLTATQVRGNLVAAGEIRDIAGASSPSRIEAGRLMAVKNPGNPGSSGNFTLANGSFAFTGTSPIGVSGYAADGSQSSHSESSWIGGNLDVNNSGQSSFTSLGVAGSTRISGGSLSGTTLNTASAILHNGIIASIGTLALSSRDAGSVQIGTATDTAAVTNVSIGTLNLNGRDLQIGAGNGQARASVHNFVAGGSVGNMVDGNITVGQRGLLALGALDPGNLLATASLASMRADSAILGVASTVVLGGSLNVDADYSMRSRSTARAASPATVNFSGNSLLVIDGAMPGVSYGNPAVPTSALPQTTPGAISAASPGTATVQSGAKIYIDHVTPGHTYVALGRNLTTSYEDSTAWSGSNLMSNNPLLELTRLGNGMEGQFSASEKAPHAPTIGVTGGVPHIGGAISNSIHSAIGTRIPLPAPSQPVVETPIPIQEPPVQPAVETPPPVQDAPVESAIEEPMPAEDESMEPAIYSRIKIGAEDLHRHSFALWALPLYEFISHFGLDGGSGSYGYRGGLGGLAIGGDYTWQDMLRVGLSLNMGAAYFKSTGEPSSTQTSATFWGLGAYGVWRPCAFSLDADINFTSIYNKIKQELPHGLDARELKADIPAWSLGMGLRAQYEIVTPHVTMRPYAGVRYLHLNSEPYDVRMGGVDVIRGKRMYQNVWTFPFGLVLTKTFRLENGYEITPLVNFKVTPASGDTYVKSSSRYADSHKSLDIENQIMDAITYGGRAGVEFRAGNFSTSINYTAQFGAHTANQGFFGVLRYEF